ncbi:thymus-specific serine protease-like [Lineus longissimus]|uniref:thymus-specific serine protease-like n=1 Tax=Lineus longissimus TaxID=88925 RepID=UPI002B4DFC89
MTKMKYTPILTILLLISFQSGDCFFGSPSFMKIRQKVEEHRKQEIFRQLYHEQMRFPEFIARTPIVDQYFTQPLDHFDPEILLRYNQRYWVNDAFWKRPDGPVFLYIGGEGALQSYVVQAGEHVDLAKKYGALVMAVEHRYYGASINDNGLELKNMQYLSSQQALADLATFHTFASRKYNLTSQNTWICFGGSYPGALSAWFRLKYPHLVYGAVASSAPVRAITNFEGYNNVVAASLADPVVNGSKKCAANIKAAFAKVDELIKGQQFPDLERDFLSCEKFNGSHDVFQFASNLAGNFMGVVQYNKEMPSIDITGICREMDTDLNPYASLMKLNKDLLTQTGEKCADNSWTNFLKQMKNTTVDRKTGGAGIRQWIYQTCTQFGYYQTCDTNTTCIFSKAMELGPNLDICSSVFGIMPSQVDKRIEFSNAYYGADQPRGTRIMFVNGSIDPWHALSVLGDASASEIAIFINGTAHCANMSSGKASDPQSLKDARTEISARIRHWLQQARLEVSNRRQ